MEQPPLDALSEAGVMLRNSTAANATFAEILGFRNIAIVATATAEAGTNAKTYAIFAYGGFGTGNSINAQMSGVGQVDNGQNGADACDLTSAGLTISNAKFHIPTGSGGSMNINGRLVINQVRAVGKFTVRFTLPAPDVSFLAALADVNFGVLDARVVRAHGGDVNDARPRHGWRWLHRPPPCPASPERRSRGLRPR